MIKALRGMKDVLFEESSKFTHFIEVASRVAKNYGFEYIETPLLEETNLFKRSVGESSDIVNKEMYQFIDKGKNDVCLRPEGTAGVVRAFIEKKLDRINTTNRFFYHGAMFRYERPQKGRLREFHQFGVESFGESNVYEDANVILMVGEIFSQLNIKFKLKLNSLGCPECMPEYRENLIKNLKSFEDKLCLDCQRRIEQNPIRVLDCKNESCQELIKESPKLIDNLCQSCDSDFSKLKNILKSNNLDFEIDTHLVRGLDYYSKTAFEFVSDEIGAQSAIAGGGRYDRLIEFLDGRATPAVGFAIGIERILDLIKVDESSLNGIYFGALDENYLDLVFQKATQKRKNTKVFIEYSKKSLKAHLKGANKQKAKYCAVIGENEANESKIWVKNLKDSNEELIDFNSF